MHKLKLLYGALVKIPGFTGCILGAALAMLGLRMALLRGARMRAAFPEEIDFYKAIDELGNVKLFRS